MNESSVSCDTLVFENSSKLYWQYDCDSVWLTLEDLSGDKIIIDQVPLELSELTYRLGYHLIKEFKNTLLFRHGCPATGPCYYKLLDKTTGSTLKEFGQLICIDTDAWYDSAYKYKFNFIVYLSYDTEEIIVYFVDSDKTQKHPFTEKLTAAVLPEMQFDKMVLKNNTLTITYISDSNLTN